MTACRRLAVHVGSPGDDTGAIGHLVFVGEAPPLYSGLTPEHALALGFGCLPGQVLALTDTEGPILVLLGGGPREEAGPVVVRGAATSFADAVPGQEHLGFVLPEIGDGPAAAATAALEGIAAARNHDSVDPGEFDDDSQDLILICAEADRAQACDGVERGCVLLRAARSARDLTASAEGGLSAALLGELVQRLGARHGFEVEVARRGRLGELGGCDLTGLDAGQPDPPLLIKIVHRPTVAPAAHLDLVCRGSFEARTASPDALNGAFALIAAMTALRDLGCATQVTGYVICTVGPVGEAALLTHDEQIDAVLGVESFDAVALRCLGPDLVAVIGRESRTAIPVAGTLCLERLVEGVGWGHVDLARRAPRSLEQALRSHGTAGLGLLLLIDLALGSRAQAAL